MWSCLFLNVGLVAKSSAPSWLSSDNLLIWDINYTRFCSTVEGQYADRVAKSTLSYGSSSLCVDCIFVVSVLVEKAYVHAEHGMSEGIVWHY